MKVVGLIAEYNPFHTGHLFHIEEAKRLSQSDFVLVLMSGDFVQRGTPALFDKYTRAEMALLSGADAVIELPVRFSCASAEYFASGAVFLLQELGVIDFLCFGSECGNLSLLQSAAEALTEESSAFQEKLQTFLKQGLSYPVSRSKTFCEIFSEKFSSEILHSLLSEPNNILALEYLKALRQIESPILPLTLKRQQAGYHDKTLFSAFASASALRDRIIRSDLEAVAPYIPKPAISVFKREYLHSFPIQTDDFSLPLYYKIRSHLETGSPLSVYQDISSDLEARIFHKLPQFTSFESFAMLLKTKQYTLTRIYRCLLHILLNIKKTAAPSIKPNLSYYPKTAVPTHLLFCIPSYARLLGFRKSSSALLTAIKTRSRIPLITKTADAQTILTDKQSPALTDPFSLFQQDLFAADLYQKTQELKFHTTLPNEFTRPLILIP